jgi:hypothetical protein
MLELLDQSVPQVWMILDHKDLKDTRDQMDHKDPWDRREIWEV